MADSSVDLTESRPSEIITIASAFTGIATATVGLKIFARARIDVHTVGWDDVFIFPSMVFSILAAFLVSNSAHMGFGRHIAAVLAELDGAKLSLEIAFYQMIGYPNRPTFNIGSFSFPNISIAILVDNLLNPNLWRTRVLFTLVTLQVMFAFLSVLILFLMCRPVEYLWDKSLGGSCWSASVMNDFSYWLSAYTAFTDIVLAIIPIVAFWKMQMRLRIKLGVCIMMGLIFISAIFTIIEATYLWLLFGAEDPLYKLPTLVIWGLSNKHTKSVSELPLDDIRSSYARWSGSHDGGSQIPEPREDSSAKADGIMRTVTVSMEWDDNQQDRECMRDDRIVLAPLR
ncbi:integral membrane protein [Seiridium cupressi]